MLIKKSTLLLATGSTFNTTARGSTTSWGDSTRHRRRVKQRCDGYATIADDTGDNGEQQHANTQSDHVWPKPPKGHTCPTPYQIFAMKHSAAYSKGRFNELVKLYHPDITGSGPRHISHPVKMERYRLIVTAHGILSDPAKRSAYDRFGAGWDGRADVGGRETWRSSSPHHPPGPFSHSWGGPRDPIWSNATWEDWERFYEHKERARKSDGNPVMSQEPVYLQNAYFVVLIVMLAFGASSWNFTRAQDAGLYFVEQRDLVHDRTAKELRRVKQEISSIKGKDERLQWFVRNRDATLGLRTDAEALREEKAARVLADREFCKSDGISGKSG